MLAPRREPGNGRVSSMCTAGIRLSLSLLLASLLAPLAFTQNQARKIKFGEKSFSYGVFAPDAPAGRNGPPLPAILLLHGAGGRGADMLDQWRGQARKYGLILIAPDLPRDLVFEETAPAFFRALVEAVKREWNVNSQQVFVFGHSMGGYLAFDAAMLESEYFAAVAVHASFITADYVGIVERARRLTPIALYIGDADPLVSIDNVRATQVLLRARGFPLHYVELRGHDHNYFAISEKINEDAWDFLRKQKLEAIHN